MQARNYPQASVPKPHGKVTDILKWDLRVDFLEEMLTLAETDYGEAVRKLEAAGDQIKQTARRHLYIQVAVGYRFGQMLYASDELWQEFQRDEFWADHTSFDKKNRMAYALMRMYNSHQNPTAERALKQAKGLEIYRKQQITASEIPERLEADRGFAGLRRITSPQISSGASKRISVRLDQAQADQIAGMLSGKATLEVEIDGKDLKKFPILRVRSLKMGRGRGRPPHCDL